MKKRSTPSDTEPAVKLLSLATLEARSSVSRHTWRLWARQRRFPVVRLGRRLLVAEEDYQAFVAANTSRSTWTKP